MRVEQEDPYNIVISSHSSDPNEILAENRTDER